MDDPGTALLSTRAATWPVTRRCASEYDVVRAALAHEKVVAMMEVERADRVELLDRAAGLLLNHNIAVLRVESPDNLPLDLPKVAKQIADCGSHQAGSLFRSLNLPAGGNRRLLLMIDDAHLLTRAALASLASADFGVEDLGLASLQIVFAGPAAIWDCLPCVGNMANDQITIACGPDDDGLIRGAQKVPLELSQPVDDRIRLPDYERQPTRRQAFVLKPAACDPLAMRKAASDSPSSVRQLPGRVAPAFASLNGSVIPTPFPTRPPAHLPALSIVPGFLLALLAIGGFMIWHSAREAAQISGIAMPQAVDRVAPELVGNGQPTLPKLNLTADAEGAFAPGSSASALRLSAGTWDGLGTAASLSSVASGGAPTLAGTSSVDGSALMSQLSTFSALSANGMQASESAFGSVAAVLPVAKTQTVAPVNGNDTSKLTLDLHMDAPTQGGLLEPPNTFEAAPSLETDQGKIETDGGAKPIAPPTSPALITNPAGSSPGVARARRTLPARKPTTEAFNAADQRCEAIALKFAVGEEPTDAERKYLRHGCR